MRSSSKPGSASSLGLGLSEKMYSHPMIIEASQQAYGMAGITPDDVDAIEVYDYLASEYLIPLGVADVKREGKDITELKVDAIVNAANNAIMRPTANIILFIFIFRAIYSFRRD
jgi:pyruvate/2-oxoglutarate/acetoin dehydrogenase E1 component